MKKTLALSALALVALVACSKKPEPVVEPTPSSSSVYVAPSSSSVAYSSSIDQAAIERARLEALLNQLVNNDVYFDYDDASIKPEGRDLLVRAANILKANKAFYVTLEGHCDERGTEEYNLALGGKRAGAALDYLKKLGVSANALNTVSKGASEPKVEGSNEAAWSQNRRVHFSVEIR